MTFLATHIGQALLMDINSVDRDYTRTLQFHGCSIFFTFFKKFLLPGHDDKYTILNII